MFSWPAQLDFVACCSRSRDDGLSPGKISTFTWPLEALEASVFQFRQLPFELLHQAKSLPARKFSRLVSFTFSLRSPLRRARAPRSRSSSSSTMHVVLNILQRVTQIGGYCTCCTCYTCLLTSGEKPEQGMCPEQLLTGDWKLSHTSNEQQVGADSATHSLPHPCQRSGRRT